MYPITFRDLSNDKKFKKYSIIEIDCARSDDDKRPESYKVNCETIRVIEKIDTDNGSWRRRKEYINKVPLKSMCQVIRDQVTSDQSLGFVKPNEISFSYNKKKLSNPEERKAYYVSQDLFRKNKDIIEEIPYQFYYSFRCINEEECRGHKLIIKDWEIYQAYRDWRKENPEDVINLIREQWLKISDTNKKEVYFYVGNILRFRSTFMVLGVFYPPLAK